MGAQLERGTGSTSAPPRKGDAVWYEDAAGSLLPARVLHVDRGAAHLGEDLPCTVELLDGGGNFVSERATLTSRLTSGRPPSVLAPTRRTEHASPKAFWSLTEDSFRELDYTWAGDFDCSWIADGGADWLAELRPSERLTAPLDRSEWLGRNTFVHVGPTDLKAALPTIAGALSVEGSGTRVSVVVAEGESSSALLDELRVIGFEKAITFRHAETPVLAADLSLARLQTDVSVFAAGWRECSAEGKWLDHDEVREHLDSRDRGESSGPPGRKAAISWSHLSRSPESWRGKGFPADVEEMMVEGIEVQPVEGSVGPSAELGQYSWPDAEHFRRGCTECDRALVVGHLERVPAHLVEHALANGTVHPWTVVRQSEDKWRACQDYSVGTNRRVVTSPFSLPSVWDVRRVIKPDSHFAKMDLRDGFWATTIRRSSRHHLMVRHPASGELLWCTSLPFGYALSPEHFCRVTEGVAHVLRQRLSSRGIPAHVFVFVDDFLIVGDDRDSTAAAQAALEALLEELGLSWAPHKTRGPARVMEFLGWLLVNVPGHRCIALSESRQEKMETMVGGWLKRRPSDGGRGEAAPRELASLLGHLVFCSEVVPGGRTYMQAMLRSFKGLEVDWMRGTVRHLFSERWGSVTLPSGFWRDLHWWRSALAKANCTPLDVPALGTAALVGTDASDFACGELVWLDGQREETRLVFTRAERRRPINFRELRGCLRVLEVFGERLQGRTVLVEIDNTCAFEAARKFYSKAEDLQELTRRLLARAERWGITLRPTHTPGAMLDRPDQTSRGDAPEAPRQRFRAEVFGRLERRFGPFNGFLGAERELASQCDGEVASAPPRLWLHPSFATVGSALRLIGERLSSQPESCARGVIIVPDAPTAAWWPMLRHFAVVGRMGRGDGLIEENRLGRWSGTAAQRESLILAFPRAAGATTLLLQDAVAIGRAEGEPVSGLERASLPAQFAASALLINADSPLPPGSILYCPPRQLRDGEGRVMMGTVYLTLDWYDGKGLPACAHLHDGRTEASARRLRATGTTQLLLEGVSLNGTRPWFPDVQSLWLTNHLGSAVTQGRTSPLRAVLSDYPLPSAHRQWRFDFERAAVEVESARGRRAVFDARALGADVEAAAAELSALHVEAPPSAAPEEEGADDDRRPMSGYAARREPATPERAPASPQEEPPSGRRLRTPAPVCPEVTLVRNQAASTR